MSSEKGWRRPVEAPTEKMKEGPGREMERQIRHPAFGQISAGRVSGGAVLYGSDFVHSGFVRIEIKRSELNRHLSSDWPHAREELIAIDMSEAQWANFVSSLNVGSGTRCTLNRVMGEQMPGLPEPTDQRAQFAAESEETVKRVLAELQSMRAAIADSGLSTKKQKVLLDHIHMAEMAAGSSQNFVADRFARHMEKTVQKAAIEINAMLTMAVQNAGLDALQGRTLGASFLGAPDAGPVIDATPSTPEGGIS